MDATPTPAAVENPPSLPPPEPCSLAMASLVFGVLGCTGIGAVIGLVCGIVAKLRISRSKGRLTGGGLALAGIIISLAMLVILPITGRLLWRSAAKTKARNQLVESANNVKQIGQAARLYSIEHGRTFPPPGNWIELLHPMLGPGADSVLHRPAEGPARACCYGYNLRLAGMPRDSANPETVLFFELQFPRNNAVGGAELLRHPQNADDRVAVCFVDGSVRQLRLEELSKLNWRP
ncbi:MAG TPA: DUF4190 domain-containing protein [Candidatus Limnocylindria bacterium]|nr:DUF4190 domain-containing protein [Candidatus Limnocylindria bacterium]